MTMLELLLHGMESCHIYTDIQNIQKVPLKGKIQKCPENKSGRAKKVDGANVSSEFASEPD